jgi:hypothetical protein
VMRHGQGTAEPRPPYAHRRRFGLMNVELQ